MKQFVVCLVMLLVCVSLSNAAIDPTNPDWVIYRDPFGSTTAEYYDQYMEVLPGDTFTLDVVVNYNAPAGTGYQVRAYISAFWSNQDVVQNWPVPNYTTAHPAMGSMYDPTVPQIQTWNSYVQLTNDSWTVRSMYEQGAENPFVVLSWDFTILPTASPGDVVIPMVFRTYDINGQIQTANNVDTDLAFTIKVLPGSAYPDGDFDLDFDVDADDIDILANAIEAGSTDLTYDVNGDSVIDEADLIAHIATLVETGLGVGTYRGDFNLDGYVDGTDLAILKASFGLTGLGYADGNANADDFVNGTDLAIFKATFGLSGTPTPGTEVPEPVTLSLLGLGGLALLRRRK